MIYSWLDVIAPRTPGLRYCDDPECDGAWIRADSGNHYCAKCKGARPGESLASHGGANLACTSCSGMPVESAKRYGVSFI